MKKLLTIFLVAFVVLGIAAVASQAILLEDFGQNVKNLVVLNYILPRIGVAFLSGLFLSTATALMAQITHNPLASDSTLGVGSGAGFFMLAGALFFPHLGLSTVASSFVGAVAALAILFALSSGRGFSVFTTTLSGLIIGLFFGSLTSLLMLFFQEESFFVAVWMSGDLAQDGAFNFYSMLVYFLPALAAILYFSRSFHLFVLGDSACKALGVNVNLIRATGLLIAAYLTALTVAFVGIIAFVGLGAYTLADRFKFDNFAKKLICCGLCGGLLLGVTDEILIVILNLTGVNLPAGGISAFLGAPLLLWLIIRGVHKNEVSAKDGDAGSAVKANAAFVLPVILAVLVAACLFSLFFGVGNFSQEILTVRINRVAAALFSGVILGVAGTVLQRLSKNQMASPELLGINSGVSLGVLAAMFLAPFLTVPLGIAGACAMLCFTVAVNYKNEMSPHKVILTGIAIMAFVSSVEKILLAMGDSRIYNFMSYASGSTYSVTTAWAAALFIAAVASVLFALYYSRQIELLNLGDATASSLGVNVPGYRTILFLFCAGISALAALNIGPVSFVGLLAPHIASFLGFRKPRLQIVTASVIGGILMVTADFLGRTLIFPYEIPSGLVATIIGSAYFVSAARKLK